MDDFAGELQRAVGNFFQRFAFFRAVSVAERKAVHGGFVFFKAAEGQGVQRQTSGQIGKQIVQHAVHVRGTADDAGGVEKEFGRKAVDVHAASCDF